MMRLKCLQAVAGRNFVPETLPFPDRQRCILTYTERFSGIISNSATKTVYQYCGNDLFDPNFTGTGGQPSYFDQLSLLYNRYRVYASAIKLVWDSSTVAQTTYADVAVVPVAATAASLSVADVMALPRAKIDTLNSVNRTIQTHAATTAEVLGAKDVEGADRLQALVTSSPSERWLWALACRTYDDTTAVTLNVTVRISYYCEFYDRVVQSLSMNNQLRGEHKSERKTDGATELKTLSTGQKWIRVEAPEDLPSPTPSVKKLAHDHFSKLSDSSARVVNGKSQSQK